MEDALIALENARKVMGWMKTRLRSCEGSPEEQTLLQQVYETLAARLTVLRDRADLAYQYLITQREAVGLRNHLEVERCFEVPERPR